MSGWKRAPSSSVNTPTTNGRRVTSPASFSVAREFASGIANLCAGWDLNIVLTGAPKRIVEQLFERFDDKIGGAIGQDLKTERK